MFFPGHTIEGSVVITADNKEIPAQTLTILAGYRGQEVVRWYEFEGSGGGSHTANSSRHRVSGHGCNSHCVWSLIKLDYPRAHHQRRSWKLTKGKFRPKLQDYVDAADPAAVKDASLKAFSFCEAKQLEKAVNALSTPLKGVGPATASAILSAFDTSVPFTSDEALEDVLGTRNYTLQEVVALANALRAEASRLNHLEKHSSESGSSAESAGSDAQAERLMESAAVGAHEDSTLGSSVAHPVWTAKKVELAIWSARHGGIELGGLHPQSSSESGPGSCLCNSSGPAQANSSRSSSSFGSSSSSSLAVTPDHPSPKGGASSSSASSSSRPATKPIRMPSDTANHQSAADIMSYESGGSSSGTGRASKRLRSSANDSGAGAGGEQMGSGSS